MSTTPAATTTDRKTCERYAREWQRTAHVLRTEGSNYAHVADGWARYWANLAKVAPEAVYYVRV